VVVVVDDDGDNDEETELRISSLACAIALRVLRCDNCSECCNTSLYFVLLLLHITGANHGSQAFS